MRFGSIFLIVVGLLLIVASPLWHSFASSEVFWDETAVEEFNASSAGMHHANTEAALDPTKMRHARDAQQRFKENQVKFERARQFRERGGKIMRIVGGIIATIGVGLYLATRKVDD